MVSKFTKLRTVSLPVLKLIKNEERGLYFVGPMMLGKKLDDQKDAATIAHAIDIETGEEGVVICPAVMVSELKDAYPGDAYVGRCFSVILTRVPEKRYNIVTIVEIAPPDDFVAPRRGELLVEVFDAAAVVEDAMPKSRRAAR